MMQNLYVINKGQILRSSQWLSGAKYQGHRVTLGWTRGTLSSKNHSVWVKRCENACSAHLVLHAVIFLMLRRAWYFVALPAFKWKNANLEGIYHTASLPPTIKRRAFCVRASQLQLEQKSSAFLFLALNQSTCYIFFFYRTVNMLW